MIKFPRKQFGKIKFPNSQFRLHMPPLLSDPGAHHEAVEDVPQRAAAQLHPAEHPAVPLRPGRKKPPTTAGLGRFSSRVAGKKCRNSGAG